MPFHKIKPLSAAIAMLTAASLPVQAQEVIEEIVVSVSPIRDSQLAALQAKRNASNMMDIVAADTIGRFPDQNLADSLGRLPGLAIERDQGQARFINLRGAPFRYTSIAFDGIDVPGAENGRIPRFDSFPSVITSRVEANKAVLPSMPGESIAGYINIHTYNPFDQAGWTMSGDVGMGEQELGDGAVEKAGLRTSWSGDEFGFVLFASQNSREQITDNREYDLETDMATGSPIVNELDFRSYKVKREDEAYGGTLEWRGTEVVQRLFVSTLYSEFADYEERNQYVFEMSGDVGAAGSTPSTVVTQLLEYGKYDNSTATSTLGMDLQAGKWLVSGRLNYTETERRQFLPITRDIGLASTTYDVSDIENPIVNVFGLGTQQAADPAALDYSLANLGLIINDSLEANANKFKLDAESEMTLFGHDAVVQVGFQVDQREADGFSTLGIGASPRVAGIDVNALNTGELWHAMSTNSIGGTYFNNIALREAWEASAVWSVPAPADDELVLLEEDITALYAMSTLDYDWGNIVLGLRAEQTDYTSRGTNNGTPIAVSADFSNYLPSAHFNFDLQEDLKLRLSASSGISRPTYNEWRASASVDVINQTVSGGNPTLEPEETYGVDSSLEWYFAPASLLSAGAFYRRIDNVIYADESFIDGGVYLPAAAGEVWTYNGTVNGKDGEFSGIEFNFIHDASEFLPEPFNGFGVSVNLTLLDSEFTGIDGRSYQLPGTSDMIYNASLFYENYGLSARINYQYRDEWISPIESPDEVWGEQKRVDFSMSYQFPWDINGGVASAYLNANNLTDEVDLRYAGNGTVNQRESYGRRYLLGLRLNF
ncbi:MAG: TonB-dependent receptor [Gammaproteobacteria bacterium]